MYVKVKMLFQEAQEVSADRAHAERSDTHECAIHVSGEGDAPATSLYLAPIDAAILGAELIAAARSAHGGDEAE